MSQPISACVVYKAALGDEETYQWLLKAMIYNRACGHYSQFGCNCKPPCQTPTEAQLEAFNKRLSADLKNQMFGEFAFLNPS